MIVRVVLLFLLLAVLCLCACLSVCPSVGLGFQSCTRPHRIGQDNRNRARTAARAVTRDDTWEVTVGAGGYEAAWSIVKSELVGAC